MYGLAERDDLESAASSDWAETPFHRAETDSPAASFFFSLGLSLAFVNEKYKFHRIDHSLQTALVQFQWAVGP